METNNTVGRHIRVLELDKVLALLAAETTMTDAADRALALTPEVDVNTVRELLKQTGDAHMLMARFGSPSFGQITNVNGSLARADMGGILSMKELLDIGELLRVIRSLQEWKSHAGLSLQTSLDGFFSCLSPNKYLYPVGRRNGRSRLPDPRGYPPQDALGGFKCPRPSG